MLSPGQKRESLAGKLLLSSALVAVSLAYGWWQRPHTRGPSVAMVPTPAPVVPQAPAPGVTAPTPSAAPAPVTTAPETDAAAIAPSAPKPAAPKSVAMAVPHANMPATAPDASPQHETVLLPATPVQLPASLAMQMYAPTDAPSPPLAPVTGTPPAGVSPPVAAGNHLQDGDYVSERHQYEWGDLRIKVSVHGGQITGVQILQYPDHRSQSLYLSQMAGPILSSEVIKTQKVQVDSVTSATDTSFAFQDTMADIIVKASRE